MEWSIHSNGEHLEIREPEDNDKVWIKLEDGIGIHFYPDGTPVMSIKTSQITAYKSIIPSSDNSIDLGISSYGWRNAHISGTLYVGKQPVIKYGTGNTPNVFYLYDKVFADFMLPPFSYSLPQSVKCYGAFTDYLIYADRKFTVTSDPAPTSGSLSNMFDGLYHTFADWNNVSTYPNGQVVIEIDLGFALWWNNAFAIAFSHGYHARYVKIEAYCDRDGDGVYTWDVLYETSNNNSDFVVVPRFWWDRVRKWRITLADPEKEDKIRIDSIHAWSPNSAVFKHASPFLRKGGEDYMYGDFLPYKNATINIGSNTLKWANIYGVNIYGDIIYEGNTALSDKYAPKSHTHTRDEITDFWNTPFWDNIPDKPSEYPPEAHTHTRSEITDFWDTPFWDNIPDKPSEYPPEAHTHDASDIVSGTLSLDRIPLIPYTKLDTVNSPSDGQVLSYSATDDKLKWVDIGDGGVGRVLIGADETEVTTTKTSYTTMKQLKLYKDSDFNWSKLIVVVRIKNSYSTKTTYIAVYIDGTNYGSTSHTGDTYTVKKIEIDISGLSNGVHNVEIKMKVSGGKGYLEFTEVWAEP